MEAWQEGKIRRKRLFETGMPERGYNQGYIFYFPNVCVPITFAGMVTQFIFMSILTMYFFICASILRAI